MFVPRQVRRAIESSRDKISSLAPAVSAPIQGKQQQYQEKEQRPTKRKRVGSASSDSDNTVTPTTAETEATARKTYLSEIRCGLELLLSDYAYAETDTKAWLLERERQIGGEGRYIHLSAFLDSTAFAKCRPEVTQAGFQRALESGGSDAILELSPDRYHLRRRNRTALPFKSSSDWDAQTIYVEPHLSSLALSPGKLISHLLCHNSAPSALFPVQHIIPGRRPSYAFVVLAAAVHDIDESVWPLDWIVLTKAEWKRRDSEYRELRVRDSKRSSRSIYSQDRTQRVSFPRKVKKAPQNQILSHLQEYPSGLLVYLSNLHPSTAKADIAAFLTHQADKHFRNNAQAREKKDTIESSMTTCSTTSLRSSLRIAYTDHIAGATTATIRLSSAIDAEKLIATLSTRRVIQPGSYTRRGFETIENNGSPGPRKPVTAELLTGERERIYWEEFVWRGNSKARRTDNKSQWYEDEQGLVYDDCGGNERSKAEMEFKDHLDSGARVAGAHIQFED